MLDRASRLPNHVLVSVRVQSLLAQAYVRARVSGEPFAFGVLAERGTGGILVGDWAKSPT